MQSNHGAMTLYNLYSDARTAQGESFWNHVTWAMNVHVSNVSEHNRLLQTPVRGHLEVRPRIISDNGPQSELRPTILNRTERLNAGTNRSKESASVRERHCCWKMRGVWWRATSSFTTRSA